MRVQSLACQTDLNLTQFDGQIIHRGHYLVVVTPSNPTYFWGNYLLVATKVYRCTLFASSIKPV
jgi:hypothetical protein